jgi:hypothetical protein
MAQCEFLNFFFTHMWAHKLLWINHRGVQCLFICGRRWFQNCKKWKWNDLKQKQKNDFFKIMGLHLSNSHPLRLNLFKVNNKFMSMNCIHVVMAQEI